MPIEDRYNDAAPDVADARLPTHSPDGVDLGLIRWFLRLSPAQRLETLQNLVDLAVEARNARASREVR